MKWFGYTCWFLRCSFVAELFHWLHYLRALPVGKHQVLDQRIWGVDGGKCANDVSKLNHHMDCALLLVVIRGDCETVLEQLTPKNESLLVTGSVYLLPDLTLTMSIVCLFSTSRVMVVSMSVLTKIWIVAIQTLNEVRCGLLRVVERQGRLLVFLREMLLIEYTKPLQTTCHVHVRKWKFKVRELAQRVVFYNINKGSTWKSVFILSSTSYLNGVTCAGLQTKTSWWCHIRWYGLRSGWIWLCWMVQMYLKIPSGEKGKVTFQKGKKIVNKCCVGTRWRWLTNVVQQHFSFIHITCLILASICFFPYARTREPPKKLWWGKRSESQRWTHNMCHLDRTWREE